MQLQITAVFQRDLNESNTIVNLVLSDRLFQTVEAVKLKAFLDVASSQTILGMHNRLAPEKQK